VVQITDRAAQCSHSRIRRLPKGLAHKPGRNRMSLTATRSVPAEPVPLTRTEVAACATTAAAGGRAGWSC